MSYRQAFDIEKHRTTTVLDFIRQKLAEGHKVYAGPRYCIVPNPLHGKPGCDDVPEFLISDRHSDYTIGLTGMKGTMYEFVLNWAIDEIYVVEPRSGLDTTTRI